MSRLESFIRRMKAQQRCIDRAAEMLDGLEGCVLEFGLGNGRTYDHLREKLPGRDIYVFERKVAAHPDCIPADDHLFLGELVETLPRAAEKLGRSVILAHMDVGSGDAGTDAMLARRIGEYLPGMLTPGAFILSDQDWRFPGTKDLPLPDGVPAGRYFFRQYAP